MSTDNGNTVDIDSILDTLIDYTVLARNHWSEQAKKKRYGESSNGGFSAYQNELSTAHAAAKLALNKYYGERMLELVGEDEDHIMINTGVSTDMCDSLKDSEYACNCPAGDRNQVRSELRAKIKGASNA